MKPGPQRWRRALRRALEPPRSKEAANERLLCREIAWYGVVNGIGTTFTSVLAVRLGASNQLLGLLVSVPALVAIVLQLPAARLVERQGSLRRVIVVSFLLNRLGYLAIALLPTLLRGWHAQALVGIVALMTVPVTVANIAFVAMVAEVVAPSRRARVVSMRNMLVSLTTTVTVLVTGALLDRFPFPANYQGAFFVAFVAAMLSLADLTRLHIASDEARRQSPPPEAVAWRTVLGQGRFVRFAAIALVVNLSLSFPSALYTIYRVRTLQASDMWIGLIGTVETSIAVLGAYLWGRVIARRGSQPVLLLAVSGFAFYPLLTALSRSLEPLLFVAIIGGVCGPAWSMSMFHLLLEVSPPRGRPTFIAIYNMMVNAAAFLAPLLGAFIGDWLSIRAGLFIAAGLRAAAVGVIALWMRSERRFAPAVRLRTL